MKTIILVGICAFLIFSFPKQSKVFLSKSVDITCAVVDVAVKTVKQALKESKTKVAVK